MAKTAEPQNEPDGPTIKSYLSRIEELFSEMASEQGSYMARCKGIRDDLKEIYVEAKDQNIPSREFKKLVWLRRKIAKVYAELQELDTLEQNTLAKLIRLSETATSLPLLEWMDKATTDKVAPQAPKVATAEASVN